jgi:hypothetical protein
MTHAPPEADQTEENTAMLPSKEFRSRLVEMVSQFTEGTDFWRRLGWAFLFFVVLAAVFASALWTDRLDLSAGDIAPRDINAPREFIDQPTTERLREQAAESVADVFELEPSVKKELKSEVEAVFEELRTLRSKEGMARADKLEEARQIVTVDVSEDVLWAALSAAPETFEVLEEDALQVLTTVMDRGVKRDEVEATREQVATEVQALEYPRAVEVFLTKLLQNRVQPNLFLNSELTAKRRRQAREGVEPVKFSKGQNIVRAGEKLTAEDIERLRDAGLLEESRMLSGVLGAALLAFLVVALLGVYLYQFHHELYLDENRLVLLGLVLVLTIVVARVLWPISGYLMPVAAGPMLLAILLNPRVAIVTGILMSTALGYIAGGEIRFVLVGLVGSMVGVFSVSNVSQRTDLMRAGFSVSLANVVTILTNLLLAGGLIVSQLQVWWNNLWGLINGVLVAVLTIGSLPFFESFFGIVTSVRLLELSNPSHPLLRRLLVEAPGTYHHSIMVANLSEAATEAVGGNALLARVGAFYHDVGKIKRPYFFVENQFGADNPHDKIGANLSSLIITSHVKDGVEFAREYGLPPELIQFIREHHGTTLVKYFYEEARQEEGEEVPEEAFRYDGPIPQSKETAVVMLADNVEAATRSMSRPTPGRLEGQVRKIIKNRLDQGQLDKSDLTLQDLDAIAESFVTVLTGIFHSRIEYPEKVIQEMERRGQGAHEDTGKRDDQTEDRGESTAQETDS